MTPIVDLITVLESEAECYEVLCEQVRNEQDLLANNAISDLESILLVQNDTMGKIANLEKSRLRLMAMIATDLGIELEVVGIPKIIGLIGYPYSETLAHLYNRLASAIDQLYTVNQTNLTLIQTGINFNRHMYQMITQYMGDSDSENHLVQARPLLDVRS